MYIVKDTLVFSKKREYSMFYIENILEKESEAIRNIPVDDSYDAAVSCIYEHVHQRNGKLIACGMGKAGQIANSIATTFSSTGTPAMFLHPSEAQHGDLGVLQKNDILLLVSNSGKTTELLQLYELSRILFPKLPIVSITGNIKSPVADISDVVLYTGSPNEICPLGLAPTTSTTVMTVIGDILVSLMMMKISFTEEEYAKRHHGGYLGKKLRDNKIVVPMISFGND
jgi:arabinose-5-phosphate isomerase